MVGKTYEFPKKYISIRKKSREVTEEQRQAAAERFGKWRAEQVEDAKEYEDDLEGTNI